MQVLKYRLMTEVNHGTEEQPDIQQIFSGVSLGWSESNEELAKREAYNGEYTIEDVSMTADEARTQRDKLLEATDWTQTLDAPIDEATKAAYRAYRQDLRDVPQQEGFPAVIVWPELPEKVKANPEPVDEAVELLLSGATGEEETV